MPAIFAEPPSHLLLVITRAVLGAAVLLLPGMVGMSESVTLAALNNPWSPLTFYCGYKMGWNLTESYPPN